MKIYVLSDNHAQRKFKAEWGLSFYIEHDGKKILFDFGSSDLFIKNAEKLGIDVLDADYYILSHGHWDHGDGLKFMPKIKVISHPDIFIKRYSKERYIGLEYTYEEAMEKFDFVFSKKPYNITDDIIFLGEIPRVTEFESKETYFLKDDGTLDYVWDDSGIVIKTEKGLVVISGCAHAGICNTIEYAKKITGIDRVYAVLGGFHLKDDGELTLKTIEYLKDMKINHIKTSHCTSFPALVQFANGLGSMPYGAGDIIEL